MHGDNTEQCMNLSNYQLCSVSEVFVTDFYISVYIFIYIYICVCVCTSSITSNFTS